LVAGIIVLLAVWSNEYQILLILFVPALFDVFTIVILMNRNEKL
jgi:hypothetical protein